MYDVIFLAHGTLGWWDELIFLGIIVIFVGMMGVSWFRSRGMDYDEQDLMPQPAQKPKDGEERFLLD